MIKLLRGRSAALRAHALGEEHWMEMKIAKHLFTGLLLGLLAHAAQAAEEPHYNVVDLQADAQREVQNDLMLANLYAEQTGEDAAKVANSVNRIVNEALRTAGEFKTVKATTAGYQTYPVYSKGNHLEGWRVRSEIRLESKDFKAASGLIGKLQSGMQLSYLGFSVSREARKSAEDEMMTEAIANFRARADIVRQALNGRGYKIQRMNISTSGFQPRPVITRALAAAEVAAPNVEGGVSQVTVSVSGTIEVE
ncbi:MAG: SIMPL domain-containing protein [Burkholderiales bacterium]